VTSPLHSKSIVRRDEAGGVSRFFAAADGLRLHMRDYGPAIASPCPVVCLPGLARTAADFDVLARRLSARGRRIAALDYRGRGLSDRDPDWRHYDIPVEAADVQTALAAAEIEQAIFIGTSRGGLHVMALAVLQPSLLRAAVLNDIGPVIETAGLERIRGYVGKLKQPDSWKEATALFQDLLGDQFTGLTPAEIEAYARLTFEEKDGALVPRYDVNLMRNLADLNLAAPLPQLWPQFDALQKISLLVIRGENSDLLSSETLAAMAARHPRCETFVVPGQGHAPLLLDEPTLARIEGFVAEVDRAPDKSA
jgi:pimeloyl-ACP methyl ester carboxylesterase